MPTDPEALEDLIAELWQANPQEFNRRTPEIVSAIRAAGLPWSRVFDRLAGTTRN